MHFGVPTSAIAGVEPVGEDVFFDADERLASGGSGALTPRRSVGGGTPDAGQALLGELG